MKYGKFDIRICSDGGLLLLCCEPRLQLSRRQLQVLVTLRALTLDRVESDWGDKAPAMLANERERVLKHTCFKLRDLLANPPVGFVNWAIRIGTLLTSDMTLLVNRAVDSTGVLAPSDRASWSRAMRRMKEQNLVQRSFNATLALTVYGFGVAELVDDFLEGRPR